SAVRTALLVAATMSAGGACSSSAERDGVREARHSELPAGEARQEGDGSPAPGEARALEPAQGSTELSIGCAVDDDCLRVEKGCCPLGNYVAISKRNADAYQASLHCEAVSCPLVMVADDH